jgi:hypothetical protein
MRPRRRMGLDGPTGLDALHAAELERPTKSVHVRLLSPFSSSPLLKKDDPARGGRPGRGRSGFGRAAAGALSSPRVAVENRIDVALNATLEPYESHSPRPVRGADSATPWFDLCGLRHERKPCPRRKSRRLDMRQRSFPSMAIDQRSPAHVETTENLRRLTAAD